MSTYLLLENPFTFTKLIKRLKIIQSNKDRDKIVTLSIAYSNLPILCVTLKYFINSIVCVKNVTAMENSYCYFLIVIFVSEVLKHYRDKICVAKWLKVLNLTMKQLKKHLTQQLNDQEVILFIIFLLFPSENWFFQAKNSACLDFVTFWSKTDKVITFFFFCKYCSQFCLFLNMTIYTDRFFEVAIESWPEWNLNPRPLNSVQML